GTDGTTNRTSPPADAGPPDDPADFTDHVPLPTRSPRQHLSHQTTAGPDAADPDADPMRPYRVHELLTRHAQGNRRGRTGRAGTAAPDGARCPRHGPHPAPRPTAPTAPAPARIRPRRTPSVTSRRTADDATERGGPEPQRAGLQLR